MGLCKHFLLGNCNGGKQCSNEHTDVRQIVKVDSDSAINGKQWPFSTYGPFKDKPSLPNFISDQSTEEMRYLCYEARLKNCFDQFHQQYLSEEQQANAKTRSLAQMTPELVETLCAIYNANPVATTTANNTNPFAQVASSVVASPFAAQPAAAAAAGSNLFSNQMNNAAAQPQQQQTSIFGTQPNTTPSIFGSPANTNPFAQAAAQQKQQQQTSQTSPFMTQQVPATAGGNLFTQQQPQQQQQTTTANNLFAQAANQFPQPTAAQAQQQQQNAFGTNTNVFAQQTQQNAAKGFDNLFSQAAVPQQQATVAPSGLFASALPAAANQQQSALTQQPALAKQPAIAQQPAVDGSATDATKLSVMLSTAIYTRLEDLTPENLTAYQIDSFEENKLPMQPPPKELI